MDDIETTIGAAVDAAAAEPASPGPAVESAAPAPAEPAAYRAPSSWSDPALFEGLSEEQKKQVLKREEDFHKGIEQYKGAHSELSALKKAIEPYLPMLQEAGSTLDVAMPSLLQSAAVLRYGTLEQKRQFLQNLKEHYQIGADEGADEDLDPSVKALNAQVAEIRNQLRGVQTDFTGAQRRAIQSEMAAFSAAKGADGNPSHPHFDRLAGKMAQLITAGIAPDLESAYQQAQRLDPDLWQQALSQQVGGSASPMRAAQDARRLAPVAAPARVPEKPKASWQDDLEKIYDSLR